MTPAEIAQIIENLKSKHSVDLNGISNVLMKKIAISIAYPLSYIIDCSITEGCFPEAWKNIKIIPIFKKKGSSLELTNYRPIAIINAFSKITEIAIQKRIVPFLEKNGAFNQMQFGFRNNRSVHEAITLNLNYIAQSINENYFAGNLLLDVKKAFDCVDREFLLAKLEK